MVSKKEQSRIYNRRARSDFELGEVITAGMALTGAETKSLRSGHGQITGAYVTEKNGELYLVGAIIHGFSGVMIGESEQSRSIKLLVKKSQLRDLVQEKKKGRTIVPLEIMGGGRFVKLKIALAKGRKKHDKRELLKKRASDREIAKLVKAGK